jgi:hypothetical protein
MSPPSSGKQAKYPHKAGITLKLKNLELTRVIKSHQRTLQQYLNANLTAIAAKYKYLEQYGINLISLTVLH